MKKVVLLVLLALVLIVGGCSSSSSTNNSESDFPNKPIKLVIPYGPGGSTDTSARVIQKVISKYLPNDQTIVVENREGGGATIGLTSILNAEPDGYTIGMTTISPIAVRPILAELEYTHDSFQTVLNLFNSPNMLVVGKDTPWDSFDEWLKDLNNGESFKYAVGGTVTTGELAIRSVNKAEGISAEAVPYEGGGPAVAALLGGHTDGYAGFPGNVTGPHKILFSFSAKRSKHYPDVPTLKELGVDVSREFFNGIIAPKGIPEDRLKIIHDAFKKAMDDPEVVKELNDLGFESAYLNSEDFQKLITESYESNKEVIDDMGLK
jgi:tripartite-type tricarboxylate transporter receptor subunit TctC